MPASVMSGRTRTFDNWQRARQTYTPFRTPTASVAATEPAEIKGGGWAALLATAHSVYARDRQMTTEERVEQELRKLTRNNLKHNAQALTAASTAFSLPPTPEEYSPYFDGILGRQEQDSLEEDEAEKMVPSINYAVAELAKSLEESRKALNKALKIEAKLSKENAELRNENTRIQSLEAQVRERDDWVTPAAHTKLRESWEAWADVAEKKIGSQQTKIETLSEEYDALMEEMKRKEEKVKQLQEQVAGYRDWTSPHERKVLDATVEMLSHKLANGDGCRHCVQRQHQGSPKVSLVTRKPLLPRQQTVA